MNHHPPDEFQDHALSALYQTTRDGVEPPAWLDKQVLAAARAAVASPPAPPLSRFRSFRFWTVPVALAATLIMAVGLVQLTRETGEWGSSMDMKAQSVAPSAAEMDAAPAGRMELKAADRAMPAGLPAPSAMEQPLQRAAPTVINEEAAILKQKADRSPEEWLAEIAEWRRQGRTVEAEASLMEFRRRYPDYIQGEIGK